MRNEIQSLKKNQTWTLVNPPQDKRILDTKWIFKTKANVAKEVERYKARLVVRGCSQITGVDYNEVYSPVDITQLGYYLL